MNREEKIKHIKLLLYEAKGWTHFERSRLENFISKAKIIISKIKGSDISYVKDIDIFTNGKSEVMIDDWKTQIVTTLEIILFEVETEEIPALQSFTSDNIHSRSLTKGFLKSVQNEVGKIVISHSSKDKELVNQFVNQICILGLGLRREAIFCTSEQGMNIKSGSDFKLAIRDELLSAKAVIQIITKNYKSSEVCLNEMGAAWAIADYIVPFVASPFDYDVGFIHSSSQQLKLNSKEDLIKFYDDHKTTLFPEPISISNLDAQISNFIAFIEGYNSRQEAAPGKVYFYHEKAVIHGLLKEGIFSHPFGCEDWPPEELSYHKYHYLELHTPIDVLSSEFSTIRNNENYSRLGINKVQLTSPKDDVANSFKNYIGKEISVTGDFWGQHTGYHRTEVLITVDRIQSYEQQTY